MQIYEIAYVHSPSVVGALEIRVLRKSSVFFVCVFMVVFVVYIYLAK